MRYFLFLLFLFSTGVNAARDTMSLECFFQDRTGSEYRHHKLGRIMVGKGISNDEIRFDKLLGEYSISGKIRMNGLDSEKINATGLFDASIARVDNGNTIAEIHTTIRKENGEGGGVTILRAFDAGRFIGAFHCYFE